MTPAQPDAAATPAAKKPRKAAGNGQWALGHMEPLNPNERAKKDDDGLNVLARIENIYSKRGFDSIDPGDLRGRMRWYGLYTQRKPGIDGGKTGDRSSRTSSTTSTSCSASAATAGILSTGASCVPGRRTCRIEFAPRHR